MKKFKTYATLFLMIMTCLAFGVYTILYYPGNSLVWLFFVFTFTVLILIDED